MKIVSHIKIYFYRQTKIVKEHMKKLTLAFLTVLMLFNSLNAQNMTAKNGDYATEWKEIQSLEEQGLPKSARDKVDALYVRAKSDDNASQIIKTLIYPCSPPISLLALDVIQKSSQFSIKERDARKWVSDPLCSIL